MLIQPERPALGVTYYLLNSSQETADVVAGVQEVHYIILIWWTDKNGEKKQTLPYCSLLSIWQKSRICSFPLPTIKVAELATEQ